MLRFALAFLLGAGSAFAQLNFTLTNSFTNPIFAGNGTIGVCMDSLTGEIWVVDFSNAVNLHRFDSVGNLLSSHLTTTCNPSLPSPNDITQDRNTGTLWIVDNDTPGEVLSYSTNGSCGSGYGLGNVYLNPVGIAHHPLRNTLFISHTGMVSEWSLTGQNLGYSFAPAPFTSTTIIAGITYYPPTGNFLVLASGGNVIYEVDIAGTLIDQFNLAPLGIANLQGLDFDPTSGRLVVCDNTSVTIHVLQGPSSSTGYQVNSANCALDFNGMVGNFNFPALASVGIGQPFTLNASSSNLGRPFEFLIGGAPLVTPATGAYVTIDFQILNINLADPSLFYFWNLFQSPPFANFSSSFSIGIQGNFSIQMVILDPGTFAGFSLSQPTRLTIF